MDRPVSRRGPLSVSLYGAMGLQCWISVDVWLTGCCRCKWVIDLFLVSLDLAVQGVEFAIFRQILGHKCSDVGSGFSTN